jgi:hypothetical protein
MVTALHKGELDLHATDVARAIERCRAEIAAIEALLLAGHPDIEGLCMALSDWSAELRLIEGEGCAGGSLHGGALPIPDEIDAYPGNVDGEGDPDEPGPCQSADLRLHDIDSENQRPQPD